MAVSDLVSQNAFAGVRRRGVATRLLEDERWLAAALLAPTAILLGLFIAYPFAEGVWLSVIDARVGVPGHFVGLANFVALWNDSIFRVAVWNTFVYTAVATVFKLGFGLARPSHQPQFPRQSLHSRFYSFALHYSDGALDLCLEVDVRSDLQRHQLDAVPPRRHPRADQLAGRSGLWRCSR